MIDWKKIIAKLTPEEQAKLKEYAEAMLAERKQLENELRRDEPENTAFYEIKTDYNAADMEAIIQKFPKNKKWTFKDLQNENYFPAEVNVKIELLNYKIYVMADPKLSHQEILTNVSSYLNLFVKKNKLGKTYVAPVALLISEGTVLKPDILFVSVSKFDYIGEDGITIAPELALEVISKANYKKLRDKKKEQYAQFGVLEYWEIYPKQKKVSIETLDESNKNYQPYSQAQKTGKVQSKVLEGFEINLEDIF